MLRKTWKLRGREIERERGEGRAGVDLRELGRWKFGC